MLGVSEATVRRDPEWLETEGVVERKSYRDVKHYKRRKRWLG